MAEYVTDDGLMDEVKGDLDAGSVEELKDFVEDMSAFVVACGKCLDDFKRSEAKCKTEFKDVNEQWDSEIKKGAKKERISKTVAIASSFGAAAVGAVGVTLVGTGIGAPIGIAALATLSIVGGVCVAGAVGGAGIAAGFAIDTGLTHKQKEIFVNASRQVVELYRALTTMRQTAQSMEMYMEVVTRYINGAEGEQTILALKYHAENPKMKTRREGETTLRYARVIKVALNSLHEAMKEVLDDAESILKKIKKNIQVA